MTTYFKKTVFLACEPESFCLETNAKGSIKEGQDQVLHDNYFLLTAYRISLKACK